MTIRLDVDDQFTVTNAIADKIAVTAAAPEITTAIEWSLLDRGGGPGGCSGGATPIGMTSLEPSFNALVARSR